MYLTSEIVKDTPLISYASYAVNEGACGDRRGIRRAGYQRELGKMLLAQRCEAMT